MATPNETLNTGEAYEFEIWKITELLAKHHYWGCHKHSLVEFCWWREMVRLSLRYKATLGQWSTMTALYRRSRCDRSPYVRYAYVILPYIDENKLCVSYLNQSSQTSALNVSLILVNANNNKKAVLSQRWPRDARYISRSSAVAEIWPFEVIQDSGGRHLEFVRIENSPIRSAVPENPTL